MMKLTNNYFLRQNANQKAIQSVDHHQHFEQHKSFLDISLSFWDIDDDISAHL